MIPNLHQSNIASSSNRGMKSNIMSLTPKHAQLAAQFLMFAAVLFLITNCIQMRTISFETLSSMSSSNSVMRSLNWNDITALTQPSDTTIQQTKAGKAVATFERVSRSQPSSSYYYNEIPKRSTDMESNLVQAGDYIYYFDVEGWDAAPVVIESHKLIFFTIPKVGCTVWKQLFRRMMNYTDWTSQDYDLYQPHNPQVNGLKYLYNYSLKEASRMMTSPDWTRAMMVRDPKQRFLSAFLDKAVGNFHKHIHDRCCKDGSCIEDAQTIPGFLSLCSKCYDDHWRPQSTRIDHKYWPYMDYILHVETAAADTEQLLQHIGAWEDYGVHGWGENGEHPIFASKGSNGAGMNHSTYAEFQVWKWYTPESEKLVERFYQGDYENPLFEFQRDECLTCVD